VYIDEINIQRNENNNDNNNNQIENIENIENIEENNNNHNENIENNENNNVQNIIENNENIIRRNIIEDDDETVINNDNIIRNEENAENNNDDENYMNDLPEEEIANIEEEMNVRYGNQDHEQNIRPRRARDYGHHHMNFGDTVMKSTVLTQYSMEKGLKEFGEKGLEAVMTEINNFTTEK
jgi:hypothetical protein